MQVLAYVSSLQVLANVSSYIAASVQGRAIYLSSYCYTSVLILLHTCLHTTVEVSSFCYICVLILLYMCPHSAMYVSSFPNVCVLTAGREAGARVVALLLEICADCTLSY
jgi:hypothetical protein